MILSPSFANASAVEEDRFPDSVFLACARCSWFARKAGACDWPRRGPLGAAVIRPTVMRAPTSPGHLQVHDGA